MWKFIFPIQLVFILSTIVLLSLSIFIAYYLYNKQSTDLLVWFIFFKIIFLTLISIFLISVILVPSKLYIYLYLIIVLSILKTCLSFILVVNYTRTYNCSQL